MSVTLTYTYKIQNASKLFVQDTAHIDFEVEYNPNTNEVEQINDVWAHDLKGNCIYIGRMLIDMFNLDGVIDKIIDWRKVYAEYIHSPLNAA